MFASKERLSARRSPLPHPRMSRALFGLFMSLLLPVMIYAKSLQLRDFTVDDGVGDAWAFSQLNHVPVSVCVCIFFEGRVVCDTAVVWSVVQQCGGVFERKIQ